MTMQFQRRNREAVSIRRHASLQALPPERAGNIYEQAQTILRSAHRPERLWGVLDLEVRAMIARFCHDGKAVDLQPENLIVLLKSASIDLPHTRDTIDLNLSGVLSRVISACIEEYFASSGPEAS